MTYRVIDNDDYKASGIDTLVFPGGEPHAKLPIFVGGDVLFVLKCRSLADIMFGACVWDALNKQKGLKSKLFITYFPGARQDRSPDGSAPITKNLMHAWFGSGATYTFDLHSRNGHYIGEVLMPTHLKVPLKEDVVGIIAPDEGAVQRAREFNNEFYPGTHLIQCSKKRDPKTGALSGYHCPDLPERGKYIIVDDICDGGGTFNLLADAFFKAKRGQGSRLELFVSHGIFSKGLEAIDPRIDHITTTDSWCRIHKGMLVKGFQRLTVLPLFPLFNQIMGVK